MKLRRRFAILVMLCVTASVVVAHAQGKSRTDPALLAIPNTGQVLHSPQVLAIFWGPEWNDPTFSGDIVSGLDALLSGYSGSVYASSATEYYDRTGPVTSFAGYLGHVLDTAAAPPVGGLTASVMIGEVCKATNNRPDPSGVYVVFTTTETAPGGTCGAYHTWGFCGSGKSAVPVQVAAVPHASGIAGTPCSAVQDTETGHSLSLAQMANLAMHELVETITDPRGSGWRDGSGAEIADKCLKVFPADVSAYPRFSDGSIWKLQAEWSNAAYRAGTGAPNADGQLGCIW